MVFLLVIIVSIITVIKAVQAIVAQQKEHQKIADNWGNTKDELDKIEEKRRKK